jgi:lauroyl/myristoyl acyltransferase
MLRRALAPSLAWLGLRIAAVLSLAELQAVMRFAARVLFRLGPIRDRVQSNLAKALHTREVQARVFAAHTEHTGTLAAEFLYVASGRELPPYALCERTRAALPDLGAAVLVSLHLGNWERVARTLASGCPLTIVTKAPSDSRLLPFFTALRRGLTTIERDSAHAGLRMLRALKHGAILGIPMDLRTRSQSTQISFFGHLVDAPIGAARIALRARVPIVVASLDRGGVVTHQLVPTEGLNESEVVKRIYAEFELRILALPEQWLWLHPRWNLV